MNKKTKGILAGVAGGALLLGAGGTFALWSDSDTVKGGTITAGHLDVNAEEFQWFDVSNDQNGGLGLGINWDGIEFGDEAVWNGASTDFNAWSGEATGRPVGSIESWRVVPGDQMLGVSDLTVKLEGDNLRAELTVNAPGGTEDLAKALGLRYVVLDSAGNPMGDAMPLGTPMQQPVEANQFRVLVVGDFSQDIVGGPGEVRSLMDAVASLNDITFDLKQHR